MRADPQNLIFCTGFRPDCYNCMHARAARAGSHAVALTDSGLGLKRASREWWMGLAGPIWLRGLAWVIQGRNLDLKLDSKIRLYIISVGDNHASWDPIGSWEFKILQHRGTQVGVGNVGVYRQK